MSRKRLLTAAALLGVLSSQTGCAVLLTGYLIGDAMQKSKNVETCRANLRTQNDQRIKEGKDAYPDMCGS